MEGSDSEFAIFTLPTLRAFVEAHSQCVWQQAVTCCLCYRMPHEIAIFWSAKKRHFFPTLYALSPVIFATATVVVFVLLCSSRLNRHCYTQHEATPTQKSAQKCHCNLLWLLAWKITKGIHSCKPASLNRPIATIFKLELQTSAPKNLPPPQKKPNWNNE